MSGEVLPVVDTKVATGTLATASSAAAGWLNVAEPIVTIVVTLAVGGATLWYTVERAMKLRKERLERNGKDGKR